MPNHHCPPTYVVRFAPTISTFGLTFLINCISVSIKRKAYMGACCLFVNCLTNLGEFTFFSMSYTGGFTWAMVFVGLALDIRKMKDENDQMRRQFLLQQ